MGLRDEASILGGQVHNNHLRGDIGTPTDKAFSIGEMQRLAVASAFMRSASEEQSVGLLAFDESGASLDPIADQGMTYDIFMISVYSRMWPFIINIVADLFLRLRE